MLKGWLSLGIQCNRLLRLSLSPDHETRHLPSLWNSGLLRVGYYTKSKLWEGRAKVSLVVMPESSAASLVKANLELLPNAGL